MLRVKQEPNKIIYFVLNKRVRKFTGVRIPGFCAPIFNSDNIHIVSGVRTITLDLPEQGEVWGSGFKSWNEIVEFFNSYFPLYIVQKIVRAEFLVTARRLDQAAFASGDIPDKTDRPLLPRRRHRRNPKGAEKSLRAH